MVLQLGEPATRIDADFDPVAIVEQYPVLLIPSGGLYGGSNPKPQCPNPNVIVFTAIILRPADATLLTANDYAGGAPIRALFIVHFLIVHCPLVPTYATA